MGDWLRHGYDKVSPDIVWDVASTKVAQLVSDCERVLRELATDKP
jgi:uncharacterized protein with HEPN domain